MFEEVEWGVVWDGAAIAAIDVAWVRRCVAWVCGVWACEEASDRVTDSHEFTRMQLAWHRASGGRNARKAVYAG